MYDPGRCETPSHRAVELTCANFLLRLHADDPQLEEMLPDRWAVAHPEAVLNHRLDESRAKATRTRARRAHRRSRPVTPAHHGFSPCIGQTAVPAHCK